MVRKQNKISSIGQITSGISVNALALRTINFVRQQLPAWRDDPDRPSEQSENKLNLQLCKFLGSRARISFPMVRFNHEEYQSGRRSVDLSASLVVRTVLEAQLYTIYDPILVLEGKRLPAPSVDREREYVTGEQHKSGGIQRFKLRLHGAKLNLAVMIGYVQDSSVRHWHKKINGWIVELKTISANDGCDWSNDEILSLLEEDVQHKIGSYRSAHGRSFGNEIELHHLWIEITNVC
jgi:hypothetical protein